MEQKKRFPPKTKKIKKSKDILSEKIPPPSPPSVPSTPLAPPPPPSTVKPKWVDPSDAAIEIDLSSVARLRKLRENPNETVISGVEYQKRLEEFYSKKLNNIDFFKWSEGGALPSSSNLDTLLNKGGVLISKEEQEKLKMDEGRLEIMKLGSLGRKDMHNAVVQCVDFHKGSEFFLSAGLDKVIKIYNVRRDEGEDGFIKRLKTVKSVYLEGLPIMKAKFINENEILACGMKKHLLLYDINSDKIQKISSAIFTSKVDKKIEEFSVSPSEDYLALTNDKGNIFIFLASTKQYLFELKANSKCSSLNFSNDSQFLFASGMDGKIYQFDLNKRTLFNCVKDVGSSQTTSMNITNEESSLLATGSSMGIVNIYDIEGGNIKSKPIKEVQNLTTAISHVEFNYSNEILLMISKWKKNAVKMLHLESKTVFSNWPNIKTQLQFVTTAKFSRNNKYLVFGNDEGNVLLYNLKHYN